MITTKICSVCKEEKPIDKFQLYWCHGSLIYNYCCKICQENKSSYYARIRFLKLKQTIINHYSNGTNRCRCCGEANIKFLTLEHMNGNGREDRRKYGQGLRFYKFLVDSDFPPGYEILCYNCNCGKKFLKQCPHQEEEMINVYT